MINETATRLFFIRAANPSAWLPENVAALLLSVGESTIVKVLMSNAINNRYAEVVAISQHLVVVRNCFFTSFSRSDALCSYSLHVHQSMQIMAAWCILLRTWALFYENSEKFRTSIISDCCWYSPFLGWVKY